MQEGILDRLDRKLGRFSDNDGSNGHRNRSWGATIFFWLCLPMVFLILCAGISSILSSIFIPKVVSSKGSYTSVLFGWPAWSGAGLMVIIGFVYSILRRKQDLDRFCKVADTLSVFANSGKKPPDELLGAFKGLTEKLVGPTKPAVEPVKEKEVTTEKT